jgi:MFS family permease
MPVKKGYENLMVLTVSLACGFVMFDRFALPNLAPFLLPELGIDAAQFGLIMSAFAFTWAGVGFLASFWSDMKENKRKLLALFILRFSICSLSTGFAAGFVSLADYPPRILGFRRAGVFRCT